jgi:hypothetical protein
MRNPTYALSAAAALAVALALPAALQAQDATKPRGDGSSMMGQGMMNMMGQMSQMMDHCNRMMQSARTDSGKPNEQWRNGKRPAADKTDKKQ